MRFLRLQGSPNARARQHIALLGDVAGIGTIPWLARINSRIIQRAEIRGPEQLTRRLKNLLDHHLHKRVYARWERRLDSEAKELLRDLSEASAIGPHAARAALFQADGLMWLTRLSFGCSSAVATAEWTESGRILVARNLDYPSVGTFDIHPCVLFMEPEANPKGRGRAEIPHVAVTAAGVHTSALTSMNREGLTLATHAHFGKRVSSRGQPIFVIGDRIIRHAKTLGQAVDIARSFERIGNWSFVVASARENEAAVIEMSPNQTRVVPPDDGLLTHSNFFKSPDLRAQEISLSEGWSEDFESRRCRLRQILEPNRGSIRPYHLMKALGDPIHAETGQRHVVGGVLSVVTTVASVVMDPENQTLWVSRAGRSPTGHGPYFEIHSERFWEMPADLPPPLLDGFQQFGGDDLKFREAVRHYRDAYALWNDRTDSERAAPEAAAALERACDATPNDGHLRIQTGILLLRARAFERARSHFEAALNCRTTPHAQRVAFLYLGRACDLLGDRPRAKAAYSSGLSGMDQTLGAAFRLKRALQRGRRRPYRANELRFIDIDLQFHDSARY